MLEEGLTPHVVASPDRGTGTQRTGTSGDPSILLFLCGEGIGEMNLTGTIQIMSHDSLSCDLLPLWGTSCRRQKGA